MEENTGLEIIDYINQQKLDESKRDNSSKDPRPEQTRSLFGRTWSHGKVPAEYYPTPIPLAERWLNALIDDGFIWKDSSILEPCAGAGNIVRACENIGFTNIRAIDIIDYPDKCCATEIRTCDFLTTSQSTQVEAVITNPPFSLAEDIIEHAMWMAPVVSFLLPMKYLGGIKRARGLFATHKPTAIYFIPERIRFLEQLKSSPMENHCIVTWVRDSEREIFKWI